jgi:hypothetical protein
LKVLAWIERKSGNQNFIAAFSFQVKPSVSVIRKLKLLDETERLDFDNRCPQLRMKSLQLLDTARACLSFLPFGKLSPSILFGSVTIESNGRNYVTKDYTAVSIEFKI